MSDHDQLARPDRIGPALARATGDERWRECRAVLISGGKSNLTFTLTSSAGTAVLRRPPSGQLLPSAHDMAREARVQRALAATTVPVPQILLTDDGELLGVSCYVMQHVEGHIVREQLPDGFAATEAERRAMTFALVDVLADLHAVDPDAVGLGDFGRPDGYLERQLRRWGQQWERSRTHEVPEVERLAARLATSIPAHSAHALVHGDYRLDNCVVDAHDPARIAAVLDWEMSTLGDPITDLALVLFYWREAGERTLMLTPAVTTLPGFPKRAEIAERYAARTGVDLGELAWYQGFAHWKFAVIAQGIAARVAAGTMAGQQFGDLESEVVQVARDGLARLEGS